MRGSGICGSLVRRYLDVAQRVKYDLTCTRHTYEIQSPSASFQGTCPKIVGGSPKVPAE